MLSEASEGRRSKHCLTRRSTLSGAETIKTAVISDSKTTCFDDLGAINGKSTTVDQESIDYSGESLGITLSHHYCWSWSNDGSQSRNVA